MARESTREFKRLRAAFKDECAQADAPCWMCGLPIDYTAAHDAYSNDDRFELDHYYPVSTRPELQADRANFRASHAGCNRQRGDSTVTSTLIGTLSRDWTTPPQR